VLGMASSLRRTLALRCALTMAVALLGIALWAYLGMRRTLRDQLDTSLASSFELQSAALASGGMLPGARDSMTEDEFVRDINRLIVLRDPSGHIVQANTGLALDLAMDTADLRRVLSRRRGAGEGTWRGRAVRSHHGPVPPGAPGTVLQVAAALGPHEAASRTVFYRMIATALLGSLASLAGAGWLARSALAPVEDIADQARAIEGVVAGQRITAHADVTELRGLIAVLNGCSSGWSASTNGTVASSATWPTTSAPRSPRCGRAWRWPCGASASPTSIARYWRRRWRRSTGSCSSAMP